MNEVKRLRELADCCYMMVGALSLKDDGLLLWLDALSAATSGKPFTTKGLLPFVLPEDRDPDSPSREYPDATKGFPVDGLRKQEELVIQMCKAYEDVPGVVQYFAMTAALAVARQAHAEEICDLIDKMLGGKVYANVAEFAEELGSRFLAQQQTKTPEERATIEPREVTYRPFDGSLRAGVCGICGAWVCDQLAHTGWHNTGLRAELAGKEAK